MKNTIFISGVHGVGKTYYTNLLVDKYKKFERISASSLIKEDIDMANENKQVEDIDYNQRIMIKNFTKLRNNSESLLLFDGHFVLIDKNEMICDINIDVFRSLYFSEIILFIDNVENIYARLKRRDINSNLDIMKLSNMQEREIFVAQNTARQLNVLLHIINIEQQTEKDILLQLEKILSKYL